MAEQLKIYASHNSSVVIKLDYAYANSKGADQPAQLRRLISTFAVRCLVNRTRLLTIPHNFKTLAWLCSLAGRSEFSLVGQLKDRFSGGQGS